MDNKVTVSTMLAQMDELERKYSAAIDEDMNLLDQKYTEIMANGGLQSANTDAALNEIKAKMRKMKENFKEETLAIKQEIQNSASELEAAQHAAETSLHDSNV